MAEMQANADMVQGYMDGFDRSAPEPSANRSRSYRHGFANARHDLGLKPRWGDLEVAHRRADVAMALDAADAMPRLEA